MNRINLLKLALTFIVAFHGQYSFAQVTTTHRLSFNQEQKQLNCIVVTERGDSVSTQEAAGSMCLSNLATLTTPLKYIMSDYGNCLVFVDEEPFYYVGESPDQSSCDNSRDDSADSAPNLIKYYEQLVQKHCSEIGNCLNVLGSRNQSVVDDTIAVLGELSIKEEAQRLRDSVERDQLNFVLPEFQKKLDQLQSENEKCQNNLNYGSDDELAARAALAADLRTISSTLEDDLFVFHWYPGLASSFSTSKEGDSNAIARAHARMLQNNYFSRDSRYGTGRQGRGLYAAAGPRATESYGNVLLKIRIPKGSRYFNVTGDRYDDYLAVSNRTIESLKTVGCDILDWNGGNEERNGSEGYYINKAAFSHKRSCRRVFNDVIKTEDYKFQSYSYGSGKNSACASGFGHAFVLIQNEMSSENVTAFRIPFRDRNEMSPEAQELYDLDRSEDELTDQRREELRVKYEDHLWRCKSSSQH